MARPFSMLLYCYYSVGGHLFTFWRVCPHDGVKIANVAKGMGNFRQLIICLSLRKKSCRVWWGCVADNENITCFWSPNWPRILKSRAMPRELLKIIIKKNTLMPTYLRGTHVPTLRFPLGWNMGGDTSWDMSCYMARVYVDMSWPKYYITYIDLYNIYIYTDTKSKKETRL